MYLKNLKTIYLSFKIWLWILKSRASRQILARKELIYYFLDKYFLSLVIYWLTSMKNVFWAFWYVKSVNKTFWIPGYWVVLEAGEHLCLMRISRYLPFTWKLGGDWAWMRFHANSGIYSSPILHSNLEGTMAFGK